MVRAASLLASAWLVGCAANIDAPGGDGESTAADSAVDYPYAARAIFNIPGADAARDNAIEDELERYIAGTPAGAEIRLAMFTWSVPSVAHALVAAQQRGAKVMVVVDGGLDATSPAFTLDGQIDRFVACQGTSTTACIGTASRSINHNKLAEFSTTTVDGKRHDRVVFSSSQNLTYTQNNWYNNALVLEGDEALYDGFHLYFDDLAAQRRDPDYFHSSHGTIRSSATGNTAYLSPRRGGDTVEDILAGMTTFETGCNVHVVQAMFTDGRVAVAHQLSRIRALGCAVQVVSSEMGPKVYAILNQGGVDLKKYDDNDDNVGGRSVRIHSKFFVVHGNYAGIGGRTIVWTGSHNFTGPANYEHDENLIACEDPGVASAYDQNFKTVWRNAVCQTPKSGDCTF